MMDSGPHRKIAVKLVLAVAMIAISTTFASAQGLGGKGAPGPPPAAPKSPQEIQAERDAERAYKNSLKNIPDQPPADPWGNARTVDAPANAAKTAKTTKTPAKAGATDH
jgi:hypothetical protein